MKLRIDSEIALGSEGRGGSILHRNGTWIFGKEDCTALTIWQIRNRKRIDS